MKVLKFGGASVKSADAVRKSMTILERFPDDNLIIVISAMGKSTNTLEKFNLACFSKKENDASNYLQTLQQYHLEIMDALFESRDHEVYQDVQELFDTLHHFMCNKPWASYDAQYDAVVSCGELLSTKIVSHYLNDQQINNKWFDARELIQTDCTHREGKVDWKLTAFLVNKTIKPYLTSVDVTPKIAITQGFIAGTIDNKTITLGREGSDYSGAILAYCCDAEAMSIWKDVPGVLNADPKYFDDTTRLPVISYKEAIELAYYGASVIHPKTIKPLQNKHIPLFVKSFVSPEDAGTQIQETIDHDHLIPSYIFKIDQILLSIAPRDFSFIDEENLSCIFSLFAKHRIKLHLMQNSAISFSVCIDNNRRELSTLIDELHKAFTVKYNEGLELITVRHYTEKTIEHLLEQKEVLLLQKGRATARLVVKPLIEVEWMKQRKRVCPN